MDVLLGSMDSIESSQPRNPRTLSVSIFIPMMQPVPSAAGPSMSRQASKRVAKREAEMAASSAAFDWFGVGRFVPNRSQRVSTSVDDRATASAATRSRDESRERRGTQRESRFLFRMRKAAEFRGRFGHRWCAKDRPCRVTSLVGEANDCGGMFGLEVVLL